jgi:hypothetical protein
MNTKDTKSTKNTKGGMDNARSAPALAEGLLLLRRFVFFVLFVSFVLALSLRTPAPATADDPPKPKPEWRATQPLAVPRGKTTAIRITGQDLSPKEIKFDDPGITAKIVKTESLSPKTDEEKAKGNTAVEAEITAPAGLAPGSYKFKLVHEAADSPTGRIYIDEPLPEIQEKEPNDTLLQPQVLPAGSVAVLGTLDKDGVDVFQIQGKAGESWHFEIIARRAGVDFEPVLRLRDPRLTPIRAAVDEGDDCAIDAKLPTDGPYLLELFDGDNRSKSDYIYRLRVVRGSSAGPPTSAAQPAP